jgi:hypothetical protein
MPDLREFDDLADDLRATGPEPRPAFAAELERRVEAGFPRARRRWAPRLRLLGPAAAVLASCLLVVVAVSALSGGEDQGLFDARMDEGAVEQSSPVEAAPFAGEGAPPSGGATAAPGLAPGTEQRRVERRNTLDLRTSADAFAEVTAGVLRVADGAGAIVRRSDVGEREGRGLATYDLRVPASRLDETLAALSRLADVRARTAAAEDVTGAYVSAGDRLRDARDERAALLRALERAQGDRERTSIRRRIAATRGRIARAERDLRRIRARTDRARIDVTVESTGRPSAGGAWTPGDAVRDAGRVLEVAAGVAVVALAVLAPLALLALLAALAARPVRRRRREAALR